MQGVLKLVSQLEMKRKRELMDEKFYNLYISFKEITNKDVARFFMCSENTAQKRVDRHRIKIKQTPKQMKFCKIGAPDPEFIGLKLTQGHSVKKLSELFGLSKRDIESCSFELWEVE